MEMNMTNLLWFFALILIAGGNGFGGLFGGRPVGPQPASIEDVNNAINTQTMQNQLSALGVETANNNYETARLIQQQTSDMMMQNNTNLINAIQGFNQVNLNLQNQTNQLSNKIDQLGYQMEQCCCSIKMEMLERELANKTAEATLAQNRLDNVQQTQTILGSFGRFVPWAGSGTQGTVPAAG